MSYVQARQYENLVDLRDRAREEVGKVVVGQGDAVDLLLVAALAQGHVLIEGPPGSAKTLLGRAMAHVLGAKFKRIQFTPGHVSGRDHRSSTRPRWASRSSCPASSSRTSSSPTRSTGPHRATRRRCSRRCRSAPSPSTGKTHQLPDPFLVIATQNPYEHEGIFPLPESQLDRFMFKIILDYADSRERDRDAAASPHRRDARHARRDPVAPRRCRARPGPRRPRPHDRADRGRRRTSSGSCGARVRTRASSSVRAPDQRSTC